MKALNGTIPIWWSLMGKRSRLNKSLFRTCNWALARWKEARAEGKRVNIKDLKVE
jgi:hypothetical protein